MTNIKRVYFIRRKRTLAEMDKPACCGNCAFQDWQLLPIEARNYLFSGSKAWRDSEGHVISNQQEFRLLFCSHSGLPTRKHDVCPLHLTDPVKWVQIRPTTKKEK